MKNQILFVCSSCGEEYAKWQGRCDACGAWNTLKEFKAQISNIKNRNINFAEPMAVGQIKTANQSRIKSITEFDRVLGGGIVSGSIILLSGDPGIGKSTLLLQIAAKISKALYVSGEESAEQIKMRFDRLKSKTKDLKILTEFNLAAILGAIEKEKPSLVIVDSIQTIYNEEFPSTPGSIVQVRECALRLQQLAKTTQTPVIIVGHVTKDGTVAGPRMLEHLVDVVLYLEGERYLNNRILRGIKNRFGATDEIGIFEMQESGLEEVKNPSKFFLEEKLSNVPGTVVTAMCEGTRSFMVEVQALTTQTVFGYPQRRASGFDLNRLQLLAAVLQKRAGINVANQDIFINIVGGLKIAEPAADLAVALAIASSVNAKNIDGKLCVFGEVGLSGEIRTVVASEKRKAEAKRLGFNKFVAEKKLSEVIRKYCHK